MHAVARGHLGRQVTSIDVGALWQLAGFRTVRCLLPPPGSLEVRGLVEALSGEFDRLGVPHAIAHRRGAPSRIESVMTESFDVAVVSSGLGSRAGEGTLDSDLPTLELGEDTYYAHDRMRVVMRGDWDESTPPQQTRVAVDRASWDQEELTEAEFPPALGFTYVDCDFPRAPVAVARGDADVAVWHQLELLVPLDLVGLTTRSLRSPAAQERRRRLSGALVVMSPTRPELSPLLRHLDVAAVRRRQTHLLSLPPGHPELIDNAWSL